jgi:hypothetical protein
MDIFYLSLVNDHKITDLLKSLKVGKIVTKFFETHQRLFMQLDKLSEKSKFHFPYSSILIYYKSYGFIFFLSQLTVNFQMDMIKIFNQLKRKERYNKLSNDEVSLLEHYKKLVRGLDIDDESFKVPVSKKGIISDQQKKFKYYYKPLFHNLYMVLKEINEDLLTTVKNESDFKVDFFDLVKILIRDKSILKDDLESQLKYGKPGNRRLKIKRVESLFLNLSDNYSAD